MGQKKEKDEMEIRTYITFFLPSPFPLPTHLLTFSLSLSLSLSTHTHTHTHTHTLLGCDKAAQEQGRDLDKERHRTARGATPLEENGIKFDKGGGKAEKRLYMF